MAKHCTVYNIYVCVCISPKESLMSSLFLTSCEFHDFSSVYSGGMVFWVIK